MKPRLHGYTLTLPGTGMDAARRRGRMVRLAAAPLKPTVEQLPCDVGLFSDERNQMDLVELAARGVSWKN